MYQIKFLGKALDDLKKIHKPHQKIIKEELLILAENPGALRNNIKRLTGTKEDFFWLKVGSYRIIFKKEEKELLIIVIRIGHRKQIYQSMD